jgi:hypothetical protein
VVTGVVIWSPEMERSNPEYQVQTGPVASNGSSGRPVTSTPARVH